MNFSLKLKFHLNFGFNLVLEKIIPLKLTSFRLFSSVTLKTFRIKPIFIPKPGF